MTILQIDTGTITKNQCQGQTRWSTVKVKGQDQRSGFKVNGQWSKFKVKGHRQGHISVSKLTFRKSKQVPLPLKCDLLTFRMTQIGLENVLIELAVFINPYFDPEFMSLALLELNLPNCLTEMTKIH